MFSFTKAFVALMATTAVLAAPEIKARQTTPPLTNCAFTITSDITVPTGTNLVGEFNFIIGQGISSQIPANTGFFVQGSIFTNTAGNTFAVQNALGIDGKTAAQTAVLVGNLAGTTRAGFASAPAINWTFNSVTCV